jgi:hypothetical protein
MYFTLKVFSINNCFYFSQLYFGTSLFSRIDFYSFQIIGRLSFSIYITFVMYLDIYIYV